MANFSGEGADMTQERPNDQIAVKEFFDSATFTLTYVVWDKLSLDAVVIDPVLDYDQAASTVSEKSYGLVCDWIRSNRLNLKMILETHAHADHLSSAQCFKRDFGNIPVAIGIGIREVQKVFQSVFDLPKDFATDGSQFDRLINHGEQLSAGSLRVDAIATPGHTPACMSYKIGRHVFVGDAMFMPDYGTGRCDFPAGSAETLYESIANRIYALADDALLYTGHDYQPGGRAMAFCASVRAQKDGNVHLKQQTTKAEFVKFRTDRDRTLSAPKLLLPSVQVNINAGRLPAPRPNGISYLSIPIRSV